MWRISQIRKYLFLLSFLILGLLVAGCSGLQIASSEGEAPTPVVSYSAAELRAIAVENVQIDVGVGSPIPVNIFVSGTWPDLCAQLAEVKQRVEDFQVEVTLMASPADPNCPPDHLGLPFRIEIPLNVVELPEGTYSLDVNGVRTTFDLPVVPPGSSDPDPVPAPSHGVLETEVEYVMASTDVNIHNGPGEQFTVIGQVFGGQTAFVTGVSLDGGWWRVICPDDTLGSCWVSADPSLTQPTTAPAAPAATPETSTGIGATKTYRDAEAGFEFDYPAAWWSLEVQPAGGHSRGYVIAFASWPIQLDNTVETPPGETRLDVTVSLWEPLDLAAYVANRKTAWDASGFSIVSEEALSLAGGLGATQFITRGPDGATAFFMFTLIGHRFVSLSGSGDQESLGQIARTLRPVQG